MCQLDSTDWLQGRIGKRVLEKLPIREATGDCAPLAMVNPMPCGCSLHWYNRANDHYTIILPMFIAVWGPPVSDASYDSAILLLLNYDN
jgi:hypothetical protein